MCNPDIFDKMTRAQELRKTDERNSELERLRTDERNSELERLRREKTPARNYELAEDIARILDGILDCPESGLRRKLEVLRGKLKARETDRLIIEAALALAG